MTSYPGNLYVNRKLRLRAIAQKWFGALPVLRKVLELQLLFVKMFKISKIGLKVEVFVTS